MFERISAIGLGLDFGIVGRVIDLGVDALLYLGTAAAGGYATFAQAIGTVHVLEIPADYLSLFGVGFLGYTGARSWEKAKGLSL